MNYPQVLIDQLSKDAPFAWFLFDQAKNNTRYHLVDFLQQRQRLEAYLDALFVALDAGHPVEDWLDMEDWGSCFIIATLGIRAQKPALFAFALEHLQEKQETHYREIADACLWHQLPEDNDLANYLWTLYQHPSPVAQQAVMQVLRTQQRLIHHDLIGAYLEHPHPAVQVQLFHWIGERQQVQYLERVQQAYSSHPPEATTAPLGHLHNTGFAAARAGFLLGDPQGKSQLEQFALTENPAMLEALTLLFVKEKKHKRLQQWVDKLWQTDSLPMRVKFYGTAVAGLSDFVAQLFEPMADETISRAAGEAFTLLAGVDIEDRDLDDDEACADCAIAQQEKEEAIKAQQESSNEKPFINAWEDNLPYPDADACYGWWESYQHHFNPQERYLAGLAVTEENLQHIIQQGNQRQRQLAALHLSLNFNYDWQDPNCLAEMAYPLTAKATNATPKDSPKKSVPAG